MDPVNVNDKCPRCGRVCPTRKGLYCMAITVHGPDGEPVPYPHPNMWQAVACADCAWATLYDLATKINATHVVGAVPAIRARPIGEMFDDDGSN